MAEPDKKKRRQNVACDSCRLRRVKCDMLFLLTKDADLAAPTPPLHVLVAQNPDVSCSNCITKGIRCTTNQIVNPAKPNKGGRRIETAKRVFGSDGSVPADVHESSISLPISTASTSLLPLRPPHPPQPQAQTQCQSRASPSQTNFVPLVDPNFFATLNQPLHSDQSALLSGPTAGLSVAMDLSAATDATMDWQASLLQSFLGTADPTAFATPSATPASATSAWGQPGLSSALDLNRFAAQPPSLTVTPPEAPPERILQRSWPVLPNSGLTLAQEQFLQSEHMSTISGKKRSYQAIREATSGESESWALWAHPSSSRSLHWSRREDVGERLADRSLGKQLSRHLIHVFFDSVQFVLPTISPESFYFDWQRAGESSDGFAPAQEALCAVMEAWASRFSDNPVILGLDMEERHLAPTVITNSGTFAGRESRLHWGKARKTACVALLKRARSLIDSHGLMTRPTIEGVQALCLYSQLHHMSDMEDDSNRDYNMEGRMIHTILVEQMRTLEMDWGSWSNAAPPGTENGVSADTSMTRMRVKQRRLFWTVIVSDAFWAAGSGNEPKISDEDVEIAGEWLVMMEDALSPSTFRALSFVMRAYHGCVVIGRTIARKLSGPIRRPGAVDVTEFCSRLRSIWRDLRALYKELNQSIPELLKVCKDDIFGFSLLHHYSSLRNSCSYLLLVMHQRTHELREFRKGLREAFVYSSPSTPNPGQSSADSRNKLLDALHLQSVDMTLQMCRAQAPLFQALHPTGLLQGASMMLRVGLAAIQFLSEIPTNEQDYPSNTPGGSGWTWETKQSEVANYIDGLNQLGWAWADVGDVLQHVAETMERKKPTPEQLATFQSQPLPADYETVAAQRREEAERDERAFDAALQLWPPPSVASIVEAWSKTAIQETTLPDFSRPDLVPSATSARAIAPSSRSRLGAYASNSSTQSTRLTPSGFALAPSRSETESNSAALSPYTTYSNTNSSTGPSPTSSVDPKDTMHEAAVQRALSARPRPILFPPGMLATMPEPPLDAAARIAQEGGTLEQFRVYPPAPPDTAQIMEAGLGVDLDALLDQLVAASGATQ